VAVSVSLATEHASIPATYQLYLPQIWANDPERRKQAGVPKEIRFQTKPDMALDELRIPFRRLNLIAGSFTLRISIFERR
jgi:SRSO17 transposase